ncbi:MAG: hypothetical protein ACTSVI_17190 [Promethearchaeota archaeon]
MLLYFRLELLDDVIIIILLAFIVGILAWNHFNRWHFNAAFENDDFIIDNIQDQKINDPDGEWKDKMDLKRRVIGLFIGFSLNPLKRFTWLMEGLQAHGEKILAFGNREKEGNDARLDRGDEKERSKLDVSSSLYRKNPQQKLSRIIVLPGYITKKNYKTFLSKMFNAIIENNTNACFIINKKIELKFIQEIQDKAKKTIDDGKKRILLISNRKLTGNVSIENQRNSQVFQIPARHRSFKHAELVIVGKIINWLNIQE